MKNRILQVCRCVFSKRPLWRILEMVGLLSPTDYWIRVVMNRKTSDMISALNTADMDALEISGGYWKTREVRFNYR